MKKKLKSIIFSFIGIFIFIIAFIFSTIHVPVFAEETYNAISIYEIDYALPITAYLGKYDAVSDVAKYTASFSYTGTISGKYSKYTLSSKQTITNQDELDYMIEVFNCNAKFSKTLLAKDTYAEDALSQAFIMLSYNSNLFTTDVTLEGHTISELREEYGLNGVVVPDTKALDSTNFVLKNQDTDAPVIAGTNNTIITSIDSPISIASIKDKLTAIDNVDGDISDSIVFTGGSYQDYYDELELDTYEVNFKCTDSANNTSTIKLYVKVVDITCPEISGPDNIDATTSSYLSIEDILDCYEVSDNYDQEEDLLTYFIVLNDDYTINRSQTGVYDLTLKCTDLSGNSSTKDITITVTDDAKPEISGASSFTKGLTTTLQISTIMDHLTAEDNIDGDLTSEITIKSDGYSGNETKVGKYTIVFIVEDNAGNVSDDFPVEITVKDDIYPIFYVDSSFINISKYETMTKDDILEFLVSTKVINENTIKNVSFIVDEYSGNETSIGEHRMSLKVNYESGESQVVSVTINVVDNEYKTGTDENKNVDVEEITTLSKIIKYIKNVAIKLATFVGKIFNVIKKFFNI